MALWRDKIRKDWQFKFEYQKKTYAKRGYKTRKEALAAQEERQKNVKTRKTVIGMVFSEAVNMYMDHAEKAFAEETYKYKRYVYQQFWFFLKKQDFPMHDITTPIVKSYLDTRHSNNNYNVHQRELSALFAFTNDTLEIISRNPVHNIKKMPHQVKQKYIPSESDIIKLIVAADPKTDARDLLLTVLHTLARIDEILKLTWADINFKKRHLSKWTRKSGDGSPKEIRVKINNELYDILWNRWKNRQQDKWVF